MIGGGRARTALSVLLAAASLSACGTQQPGQLTGPSATYPRAHPNDGYADLDAVLGSGFARRPNGSFGGERLAAHAATGTSFHQYAEVFYPAGSASQKSAQTDASVEGGFQAYYDLTAGQLNEAYLRYWVYFPANFQFVKGGKLPGLFGGTQTSGGKIPDGANGFSTRYMWREDGAGEVYAYLPSSQEHGTSLGRGDWSFPTGRWTCLVQHVRLNTPNQPDGSIDVEQDGRVVSKQRGLIFRTTDQLRIEGLFFSSFFGGGDASWASPSDQFARFGGFDVSAQPLTCAS